MEYLCEGCWPYRVFSVTLGPSQLCIKSGKMPRETPQGPPKDGAYSLAEGIISPCKVVLQPGDPGQRSFQSVSELRGAGRGLPVAI